MKKLYVVFLALLGACSLLSSVYAESAFAQLHPVFDVSKERLEHAWDFGYQSKNPKNSNKLASKLSKSPIKGSRHFFFRDRPGYMYLKSPLLAAYLAGSLAKQQLSSPKEVKNSKELLLSDESLKKQISLHVELCIMPSFFGDSVQKLANPHALENVRVVMRVGGRDCHPVNQPSHIPIIEKSGEHHFKKTVEVPGEVHIHTCECGEGCTIITPPTLVDLPAVTRYTYYESQFDVAFNLFDEKGLPLIRKTDSTIEMIVMLNGKQCKAIYKLKPWEKAVSRF